MTKITEHFSLEEFACHDADRTPYPPIWINDRLIPLCYLLELIRGACDRPITIISGYRTNDYNRKIGGARRSQHIQGRAADIVVKGLSAGQIHMRILAVRRFWHRLGGLGLYQNFVHVDIRSTDRLVRWRGSRTAKETVA